MVLLAGCAIGGYVYSTRVQRDAAAAIERAGGTVIYSWQVEGGVVRPGARPWAPRWLVNRLGADYFGHVVEVRLNERGDESVLAEVAKLGRLETLVVQAAPMTDRGIAQLDRLAALRSLALASSPGLTDAGLAHLATHSHLEELLLVSEPEIDRAGLGHLKHLQRLRILSLSMRSDDSVGELADFPRLNRLYLNVDRVTERVLRDLARVAHLEELGFGAREPTAASLDSLSPLTNLKILKFWGPWLDDAALAQLGGLKQLRYVELIGTNVTPAGVVSLQRSLPELRINRQSTLVAP
jgi:hypothetical protein